MKTKTLLTLGAIAAGAYLFPQKSGGIKGLGEIDTTSPEYQQWYYNTYLPYIQQQGSQSNQYGGYGMGPQQCQQQGGIWDSFANQCSSPNPTAGYQNPGYTQPSYYNPYQTGVLTPSQCQQSGGYWDSFSGQCINQPNSPSSPYMPPQQYPQQYPPIQSFPTAQMSVDQLLSQGLSAGMIFAIKQGKAMCKANQSQYCNVTFSDSTGKKKMSYKVAAAYVKKFMGVQLGTQQPNYLPQFQAQPAFQPGAQPGYPQQQYTGAVPGMDTNDLSWAM